MPLISKQIRELIHFQKGNFSNLSTNDLRGKIEQIDKLTLMRFYLTEHQKFSSEVLHYISSIIRSKKEKINLNDIYSTQLVTDKEYDLNQHGLGHFSASREHCKIVYHRLSGSIYSKVSEYLNPKAENSLLFLKKFYSHFCPSFRSVETDPTEM